MMTRIPIACVFAMCSIASYAQLSNAEAIERASSFARRLFPEQGVRNPSVWRQPNRMAIRLDEMVDAWWRLNLDGSFSSYFDARRNVSQSGQSFFASEDATWLAAERIIARFDPPQGLQRHLIERRSEATELIYCRFDVKPYGHWSWSGNSATVAFQSSDGAIVYIGVSRGWSYEPPNIRIPANFARQIASTRQGGSPAEWDYELMWFGGTDPDLTPALRQLGSQKIERLVYSMFHSNGDGVIIDSVTGEVIAAPSIGGKRETTETSPDQQANTVRNPGSIIYAALWLIGSTLTVLIAVLLSRRLLRKP